MATSSRMTDEPPTDQMPAQQRVPTTEMGAVKKSDSGMPARRRHSESFFESKPRPRTAVTLTPEDGPATSLEAQLALLHHASTQADAAGVSLADTEIRYHTTVGGKLKSITVSW